MEVDRERRAQAAVEVPQRLRQRKRTAAILTLAVLALGVVLVATLGPDVLPIYLVGLPLGLTLLWGGVDALRSDERGATHEEPASDAWPNGEVSHAT